VARTTCAGPNDDADEDAAILVGVVVCVAADQPTAKQRAAKPKRSIQSSSTAG
jgi:hypothetical protein